jgi:hypothetical protein
VKTLTELVRQSLESDQLLDPEVYPTLKSGPMALKSLKFAVPIRRLNIVFGELPWVNSWRHSHSATRWRLSHSEASIDMNTKRNRTETDFGRSVFANGTAVKSTLSTMTTH